MVEHSRHKGHSRVLIPAWTCPYGKGNGLIFKFGMMFMIQTTISADIPMVVVVEIDSKSHRTLLVKR